MDVSFRTKDGRFNCRACAVMVHNGKLLVMRDENNPYYCLPGGRVRMGETARETVIRELREKLLINAVIERPLWRNQSFLIEDESRGRFHEICKCFLVGINRTDLLSRGDSFCITENGKHRFVFSWLNFQQVENSYFYPETLKSCICSLPEQLEWAEEHALVK